MPIKPSLRPWLYSVAALAGFLLVSYAVITWGFPLVMPFLIAAILAEVINPAVDWLSDGRRRLHLPRSLASALVLALLAGLVALVGFLAVARLVRELTDLVGALPYYTALLLDLANGALDELGRISQTLPASAQGLVAEALGSLQNLLRSTLPTLARTLSAFAGLPGLLADVAIVLIATFFISRDRRSIGWFLLGLLPREWRPRVRQVKQAVWSSALGFARAQFTLITTTMLISIAGLLLVGAEYAVLMGILVGVADVLPMVGPSLVYVPWILFQFASGHPGMGLKLLAVYACAFVVRQIMEPRLVSQQTGLHPLTTLLSMYLGFHFFGGLGFVLGPLLAILLTAMVRSGLLPIFQTPDE